MCPDRRTFEIDRHDSAPTGRRAGTEIFCPVVADSPIFWILIGMKKLNVEAGI